jgi:hypothetical protein
MKNLDFRQALCAAAAVVATSLSFVAITANFDSLQLTRGRYAVKTMSCNYPHASER